MYSLTTVISAAIGGAVAGGTTVYFTVTRPTIKRLKELVVEESQNVENVREYYRKKYENVKDVIQPHENENDSRVSSVFEEELDGSEFSHETRVVVDPITQVSSDDKELDEAEEIILNHEYATVNDKFLSDLADEEVSDDVPEDDDNYHQELSDTHAGVERIIETLAEENEWGYDMSFMKYFHEDDILVDSANVPVEDVRHILGSNKLIFHQDDLAHFVNHDLRLVIEVSNCEGTFAEFIYGRVDPNDPMYHPVKE